MAELKDLRGISMIGIDPETYEELLEIAKREGKSVVDITSDAIKTHIENKRSLKENVSNKRLLCEG